MKSRFLLTLLVLSFIVQQCAKQTAPTGGPKDETAPKLTYSNPANKETKFKKERIELEFDENVQLNNPREQILITPTIGKKFEVTVRKNKVILELKSTLRDSTTYNINFRECIQDLNEKNTAIVKLAFSTGEYIDSLSIAGSVKDVLTDTESKNYTVALTEVSDTFNIFKHQASWITLTDKEGKFSLQNLKPGRYTIYAFDDRNKNLTVDSKSEKYGFKPTTIELKKSIDGVLIPVFKLDASQLKIISAKPIFNYYLIRISKGISSYSLEASEKKETIFSSLEPDKSSIKIYNTLEQKSDSLQLKVFVSDSTETKIDTLFYLKFNQKESPKGELTAKIDYTKYLETNEMMFSSLSFNKPIVISNTDSIYLQLDSLTRISFTKEDLEWDKSLMKVTLKKKYKEPTLPTVKPSTDRKNQQTESPTKTETVANNTLTFPKGTFISVEADTATRLTQAVKKLTLEQTGVILAKVVTNENFIIQLTTKNNELIEQAHNIKNHKFENLPPSTYLLKLIIDLNKNGKWDPGNVSNKLEPEPIIIYTNSKKERDINLKANWEVGPLLITY